MINNKRYLFEGEKFDVFSGDRCIATLEVEKTTDFGGKLAPVLHKTYIENEVFETGNFLTFPVSGMNYHSMIRWLEGRMPNVKNPVVREVLGNKEGLEEVLRVTNGVLAVDNLWLRFADDEKDYTEVLKQRRIILKDKEVITLEGEYDVRNDEDNLYAVGSSRGKQPKYLLEDKGVWVKQDTSYNEGVMEYLASIVLENSTLQEGLDYVKYRPCKIQTSQGITQGCVSKDYRMKGYSEVTLGQLLHHYYSTDMLNRKEVRCLTLDEKIDFAYQLLNQYIGFFDFKEGIKRILAFDALILNEGRQLEDIVFLTDGCYVYFAPIHDNAMSLLTRQYSEQNDVIYTDTQLGLVGNKEVALNKAKPSVFTKNFRKQVKAYDEEPFIYRKRLLGVLEELGNTGDTVLKRSIGVLKRQLNNPYYSKLMKD